MVRQIPQTNQAVEAQGIGGHVVGQPVLTTPTRCRRLFRAHIDNRRKKPDRVVRRRARAE